MGETTALALVRLRSRQPDGTVIGESRRTCHLVPVPDSTTVPPEFLVACCGLRIGPGQGEVLPEAMGTPCELCMSRSSMPQFSMLAPFRGQLEGGGRR